MIDGTAQSQKWWKELIIYQIYPRSFYDTSGNGIGDLKGILAKLDYVKSLGVNAVWINPIYQSPNHDNGYDISDYRQIMDEFGSMQDFDNLIEALHKRDIKFIMDLVVNHTSHEHEWFKQSASSRDNPYRDYYHWWPAEKGKPPYRWSYFDEKAEAWQYYPETDAYCLQYFSRQQPDLHWENPKVRQEVYDIMAFWAEKGVDGFRLDAFQFVSKDTSFPELPKGYEKDYSQIIKYHAMGPNLHAYLREMNEQILSRYSVFAVSEGAGSGFEDAHNLVDEERRELQMVYHFDGVDMGNSLDARHTLADFKRIHSEWDAAFAEKGWLSIFLANHDLPRMVSKFGNHAPEFRAASAKMLNTFLLTMRGTPYCYYGDEIGMTNIGFASIEDYRDIAAVNSHKKAQDDGEDLERFMQHLQFFSRDNSRTPMQWSQNEYAGFSSAQPWLAVNPNYLAVNVAQQEQQQDSVLHHFRHLTKLRRETPLLIYGRYQIIDQEHPDIYAYKRYDDTQAMLIVLSFVAHQTSLALPADFVSSSVLANSESTLSIEQGAIHLTPYQAVVLKRE